MNKLLFGLCGKQSRESITGSPIFSNSLLTKLEQRSAAGPEIPKWVKSKSIVCSVNTRPFYLEHVK